MEKEKQTQSVKICPICSNSEIAIVHSPIDDKRKTVPKFAPMGCLEKACKFYNEQMKECIFVIQTIMVSNIANKMFEKEIKGE